MPPTLLPSGQMRATSGTASAEQSGSPGELTDPEVDPEPLDPAVELPLPSDPDDAIEPDELPPVDPPVPEEPPPVPGSTLPMQPMARTDPRASEAARKRERTEVRMAHQSARGVPAELVSKARRAPVCSRVFARAILGQARSVRQTPGRYANPLPRSPPFSVAGYGKGWAGWPRSK
jgi:hypothetical protein